MDRNEQIQKMDELRDAMKRRDFDRAVDIADSLDLKRIKDNNILSLVADAYEVTHNFEEAKEALTIAYENTNAGRLIAYKLCLISVKTKDFAAARSYYEDFIEMAPRDTARYILRYRMAKAQGKPIEELINILEEYVNLDMEEKWAYELAKLYYKAGKKDKCLDICDEINLWFSEGKYVKKASDLKEKINNPKAAKIKKEKEKKAETLAENSADEIIEITDISEDGVKAKIVEAPKMTEEPTIAEIVSNENGQTKEEVKPEPEKTSETVDEIQFLDEDGNVEEKKIISKAEEKSHKKQKRTFRPFEINPDMIQKDTASVIKPEKEEESVPEEVEPKQAENEEKNIEEFFNLNSSEDDDMEEIILSDEPETVDSVTSQNDKVPEIVDEAQQETKTNDDQVEVTNSDNTETVKGTIENGEFEPDLHDGDITVGQLLNDEEQPRSQADEKVSEQVEPEESRTEKLTGINDVSDILRQLQERGILKPETVKEAVDIINEAAEVNDSNSKAKQEDSILPIDESVIEESDDELVSKEELNETEEKVDGTEIDDAIKVEESVHDNIEIDESDIVLEEDLEENKNAQSTENIVPDDLGSTRIFGKIQIPSSEEEQPNVSRVVKPQVEEQIEEGLHEETGEVPALDLGYKTPTRDESNDLGQKKIYKNIAANSDMGYKTDKLPTRDELQKAIKEAEEVVSNNQEDSDVRVKENPTSKVEILAGAGIVPEGEFEVESKEQKQAQGKQKSDTPVGEDRIIDTTKTQVVEKKTSVGAEANAESVELEEKATTAEAEEKADNKSINTETRTEEKADNIEAKIEEAVEVEKEADEAAEAEAKVEDEATETEANVEEPATATEAKTEEKVAATAEAEPKEATENKKTENKKTEKKEDQTMDNNIVRENVLSEAELTEFKNYLNVEGFEINIREVLQELIVNYSPNGKSEHGNVIIMGNEKTGKTTLAIELIKLVNRKRGRRNRKLAKVDARVLNRKGFKYVLGKLVGSDLIIENADQLGKMTVISLLDGCGMFTDDMLIILEGNEDGMEELLKENPKLETTFNHIVRIKEYNIEEWVEYGKRYALNKGYEMDELANLAFYKAIDDYFGANKGISQDNVEEIIDNAIAHTKKLGRKFKGIFGSKSKNDGLNLLQESDFEI